MPLRDDLLNPIPGDNPSGRNLRYDPITDKVKEARRQDDDIPQGQWQVALKVADWPQVIKLAGDALAKQGKDLQLAVWLVDAHVRREGFAILPTCFQFLRNLVDQFWDTLYPEIEDGDVEIRGAPLEWLGTKFEEPLRALPITRNGLSWLKYKESRAVGYEKDSAGDFNKTQARNEAIAAGKVTGEDFDAGVDESPKAFYDTLYTQINDSLAALAELAELCDAKFGEYGPSFVKTRSALEEIGQTVRIFLNKKGGPAQAQAAAEPAVVEAAAAAPAAAVPVAAAAPVAAVPQPVAAAPVGGGGIDPADLPDAARRLGAIARYLRKQDVYNISAYLILRGYRFGEIRYNGPDIKPAMLEAPPSDLRAELKRQALEQNWDGLLNATEAAMELPCGRAWLDIQRYAVTALDNKGEWFKFVADAIRAEVRGLLRDLPGLLQMTMLDDTPTANPETMAWLRDQQLLPGMGGEAAPAAAPAPPAAAMVAAPAPVEVEENAPFLEEDKTEGEAAAPDAFELAMEAAKSGRQAEAIEILTRELETERSGRGRFLRRTQLAHLLMAGGREQVAMPMLEQLAGEIDERKLEQWEAGDALAYPLSLLLKCLRSAGDNPELTRLTYARICRLDPIQALKHSE